MLSLTAARESFYHTLTSLAPDHELHVRELALKPEKRHVTELFDKMTSAVSSGDVIEIFRDIAVAMRTLSERREALRHKQKLGER
jgi:hypothetical protein